LSHDNDATFTDLVAADSPDPAREAVTAEFTALIATCMEKLEPSHREILPLRDQLHRPYDEIAATLARVPQLEQEVKIVSEESGISSGAVYEES